MLVDTKEVSLSEITNQWATDAIAHANLPHGDAIREVLGDLSALSFSGPVGIIKHLTKKAESYGHGEQFNITPLIELTRRIIKACEYKDDAQDISSPFITAYMYNSSRDGMDKVRIPINQILYFIKVTNASPGRAYQTGKANVILNDQNRTELNLIDCSKNNTAEFLLDCYIKSAEEVVKAWTGK